MTSQETERVAFVSGANRGIGNGLALGLLGLGYQVVGGYRDEGRSSLLLDAAAQNGNLHPFKVDVTSEKELESLRDFIAMKLGRLDVLVNNAGVNPEKGKDLNELEWETFSETFRVNVGGPFLTTRILYPLLLEGSETKIVNISSIMASIQLSDGTMTPYRVSKAAVNMLAKSQAVAYEKDGITVVCIHPGWVRTDMGGSHATFSVEESVERILSIVQGVSLKDTGRFISAEGGDLPY